MNNYNMSSTGYNIEFTAFYDTDLSQIYFNDNFTSEGNETSVIYTGYEHKEDDFIITVKETEANRVLLIDPCDDDPENYFEDLVSQFNYDNCLKTIHDKLTEYTLAGIEYDCNFMVMISHGYSQGDVRAVYVLKTDEYLTREMIDHYLWDAPITARININGDDVLFEDEILGDDFYQWDADAVRDRIAAVMLKMEYNADCIAEVIALIPQNPEYD